MTVAESAERCMVPGAATTAQEECFLLALTIARLRRVRTDAGSHDHRFVRELPTDPAAWTDAQRTHVIRLAWRYRWQMPPMLRPGADPDAHQNKAMAA